MERGAERRGEMGRETKGRDDETGEREGQNGTREPASRAEERRGAEVLVPVVPMNLHAYRAS